MDVCNLIVVTTLNAVLCTPAPTCSASADGTKSLCMSIGRCEMPPVQYECKRADGTSYIWSEPNKGPIPTATIPR